MEITIEDFLKLDNVNVIDIRDSFSYDKGHIRGAKNICFDNLILNPGKYLNMDDVYYIYCQRGVNSKRCVSILRGYGYKVYSIVGGYNAYILSNMV